MVACSRQSVGCGLIASQEENDSLSNDHVLADVLHTFIVWMFPEVLLHVHKTVDKVIYFNTLLSPKKETIIMLTVHCGFIAHFHLPVIHYGLRESPELVKFWWPEANLSFKVGKQLHQLHHSCGEPTFHLQ